MFKLESVHWWYRGLHDLVERIVRKLSSGKRLKILDAGCGTGRMMEMLSKYGDVTGIDRSPDAIGFCFRRGLTNLKTEDLNTWAPPRSEYDLIVSNDVLSDANIQSETAIVQKFSTALKTRGYLVMNLPAFDSLKRGHDQAVSTKRRFRKRNIIPDLDRAGFRILKASYRLPLLFVFILLRKNLSVFGNKNEAAVSDLLLPVPPLLNAFLFSLHCFENLLFVSGVSFFPGSSLFLICQKK